MKERRLKTRRRYLLADGIELEKLAVPVTVLSIRHATEVGTGEHLYRVTFGQMVDSSGTIATKLRLTPRGRPKKVGKVSVVLYLPDGGRPLPYRVGSNWLMKVDPTGDVVLEEQ